jgi:archaeosortase A (PGF-CTERM-specific)
MPPVLGNAGLHALFVGSGLSLVCAALGYRLSRERAARVSAIGGYALLSVVFAVLTLGYVTSSRSDRLLLLAVTLAAVLVSLQAIRLTSQGWSRDDQLATTIAAVLVIILPFELIPELRFLVQETIAVQLVWIVNLLGYEPTLEAMADGQLTRLTFDNDGFYYIARECTGIDGVALFGGILVGVRTTLRRKLAGAAFMLVAVYVVNMLRMVFVVAAISGDWFGPLLTDGNTVQMTYLVAEVAIGQSVVVLASVAGYLWVSTWIPDGIAFATDFMETFVPQAGRETA